jgi:hypothetical protein
MLAFIAWEKGDYVATIDHIRQAIAYWPTFELNMMMVTVLLDAGNLAAARNFVDDAEDLAPVNPVKAMMWRRDLNNLREHIRKLERNRKTNPTG